MAIELRSRFLKYILKKWQQNDHNLKEISCVYVIISLDIFTHQFDIEYIGSTTLLFSRYKSHKIPEKIQKTDNKISLMYYKPMDKGFYDYEVKLIKKLQPFYNKQHKKGGKNA
jgi:hypothetical protein